jgi:hypothetical protein
MKFFYKWKFYTNLAFSEVGWLTNKFPEVMAVIFLLEKFGVVMSKDQIILFSIFGLIGFFMFGYVWKKLGYYDIEQHVNAKRNPVTDEIYTAARRYNERNN